MISPIFKLNKHKNIIEISEVELPRQEARWILKPCGHLSSLFLLSGLQLVLNADAIFLLVKELVGLWQFVKADLDQRKIYHFGGG
jgi:hypothetical protein